jgi:hypothetical protein
MSYKGNNRRGGPTGKRVAGSGARGRLAIAKNERYVVTIYTFYVCVKFQIDPPSRYLGNTLALLKGQT